MGFLSGWKERSFLFDTQPLELGLKLSPIKRLEAEDSPVNVEGGHYPFSAVSLFHEARALDGLFDIDFVVEYSFVVEEALGLMAICAPTRRIYFNFGHISPPKLSCSGTERILLRTDSLGYAQTAACAVPHRFREYRNILVAFSKLRYNDAPRC